MMSTIMPFFNGPLPVIGATDYSKLSRLVYGASSRDFGVAAELIAKLERACVPVDDQVPHDAVQRGTTVTYEMKDGSRRTITLVYPDDVDARVGKVSVLTPFAAGLLGLRTGQPGEWFSRNGQKNLLAVARVTQDLMLPSLRSEAF